jgi:hypothetical protein
MTSKKTIEEQGVYPYIRSQPQAANTCTGTGSRSQNVLRYDFLNILANQGLRGHMQTPSVK